jgi:phage-related protein
VTLPTFTPPYPPIEQLEDSLSLRQISVMFGDGYTQNTPDGLNVEQSKVSLTFEPLSLAQYLAIESFLEANAGQNFYYTLQTDGVQRVWSASSWTPSMNGVSYSISVSLTQFFTLGA